MARNEFRHNPISGEESGIHELDKKERNLAELQGDFQRKAAELSDLLSQSSDSIQPNGADEQQLLKLGRSLESLQTLISRAMLVSSHESKRPSRAERETLNFDWFRVHMFAYLTWVKAYYPSFEKFQQDIDGDSSESKQGPGGNVVEGKFGNPTAFNRHFDWLKSHEFKFNAWIKMQYPKGVVQLKEEILHQTQSATQDTAEDESLAA